MNFSSSVVLWIVHYTPRTRKLTPDMMLLRRFFYLLALLLSVAIVCVAAGATNDLERMAAEHQKHVDEIKKKTADVEAKFNAQLGSIRTPPEATRIAADNEKALREAGITISGENGGAAGAKSEGKNAASVSSVWMSASLLIVVTLAFILVC
ncbi:uncharacterized protein TM35_000901070 [Trypanosoma theileri]|uniref:Uncharacterized protein n=1 Tax=Trypanosoma theileri TaxID=67003 RepID=A0A1X0NGF1_9TRYP|nr:uncharacterized protein TM35_000901070 [Trypanosoma theileri]ORC82509.1 hypothetical protein TM35_000901070 [Trypanosoma theileri]